jgi:hypothetical protein
MGASLGTLYAASLASNWGAKGMPTNARPNVHGLRGNHISKNLILLNKGKN